MTRLFLLFTMTTLTVFFQNCSGGFSAITGQKQVDFASNIEEPEDTNKQINENTNDSVESSPTCTQGQGNCDSFIGSDRQAEMLRKSNPGCVLDLGLPTTSTENLNGRDKFVNAIFTSTETNVRNGGRVAINGSHSGQIFVRDSREIYTNGMMGNVFVEDVSSVKLNGMLEKVVIDSPQASIPLINGTTETLFLDVNSVSFNGRHRHLCVKANRIPLINGIYGSSMSPSVFIGTGSSPKLGTVNGNQTDLYIENFQVDFINGRSNKIHLYNSDVKAINGDIDELYLLKGTNVEFINGRVNKLFIDSSSSLDGYRGSINIQEI